MKTTMPLNTEVFQLLRDNIERVHTTSLGVIRIRRNLFLTEKDIEGWCKTHILAPGAKYERRGKNLYVTHDEYIFTVNASSFTIITVHRQV